METEMKKKISVAIACSLMGICLLGFAKDEDSQKMEFVENVSTESAVEANKQTVVPMDKDATPPANNGATPPTKNGAVPPSNRSALVPANNGARPQRQLAPRKNLKIVKEVIKPMK